MTTATRASDLAELVRRHLDLSPLVPEVYAEYRPLIRDALAYFVEGLPADRAERIFAEQAAMPGSAGVIERLVALMHQCPTLHKLGQVVSRHRQLDASLRERLQQLETLEPRTPIGEVRAVIDAELPSARRGDLLIEGAALAEASVAVVVPCRWRSGDSVERRGVLKVLKPGIEERLDQELAVWGRLGAYLDDRSQRHGLPRLDYEATTDQVNELLSSEVHLAREQAHMIAAADVYRDDVEVQVPEVWPFCTNRVTGMQRLDGQKVTDVRLGDASAARRLAQTTTRALIADPMWCTVETGVFHADPHAGNMVYTDDGALGLLDWSLVGRLPKRRRELVSQVFVGAVTFDGGKVAEAIASLADRVADSARLGEVVDGALQRVCRGEMPGLRWFVGLLDASFRVSGVRFDGDLVMFRKTLLTLEGVVADVSPDFCVDTALVSAFVGRALHEWPSRFFAWPTNRDFATHLSNSDIAAATMSLPVATARLWSRYWRDWLGRASGR